jgi:Ca2+-transporting ATPase
MGKRLKKKYPRQDEIPFDSATKYMAVTVKDNKTKKAIVKGAPEVIFNMCNLSPSEKKKLNQINDSLSSKGLRVLAMADKPLSGKKKMKTLKNYQFKGLMGMYDPPRKEVPAALKICQRASVRVLMITGDHKKTAEAIGKEIGLETPQVITGNEIDSMANKEFKQMVKKVNIFARVSPSHKVQICKALQKLGHQVAMTGDGVNDAPAVKRADVGIAVGSGTDLTKGISDMILLDDDFSTISKGIKEGRRVFFNIKKFIRFMMSSNFDEIFETLTSIIFNLPLPYLPLHILFINLATDSLPALALASDVAEEGIMDEKPYKPKDEIMKGILPFSIMGSIIDYSATIPLFLFYLLVLKMPSHHARTMNFAAAVFYELFFVFAVRNKKSVFTHRKNIFNNKMLLFSVAFGIGALIFALYTPIGIHVFDTEPLKLWELGLVMASGSSGFVIVELLKFLKEKFPQKTKFIPTG